MKKIKEFLKTNIILLKWTLDYFFIVGFILWFLFKFDIFSKYHWWKFFHASLHGFWGFVFGAIIYTAIPIYIATALIIYNKKTPVVKYSFIDTAKNILLKILPLKSKEPEPQEKTDTPAQIQTDVEPEFPSDLPPELRVPYMRAKQNMSLTGITSSFNKAPDSKTDAPQPESDDNSAFPIPTDFDISEIINENESANTQDSIIPTFKDINFDEPITPSFPKKNSIIKYFESKNTEYETYNDYVITKKYLVYDHDDQDFWIMDEETWFASGKQKKSPIKEMLEMATHNNLTPVIYLESQNIMDMDGIKNKFESLGIRVITAPEELD